jgi:hypothetical protein
MSHNGGVRQQEEGLSHQRAKGRDSKAEYLPGMALAAGHGGGGGLLGHAASLTAAADNTLRR